MQMTPPLFRKWRTTKEPLDEIERGERKTGLELNIQKLTSFVYGVKKCSIIQSEVSQKDKDHYNILTHIYGI